MRVSLLVLSALTACCASPPHLLAMQSMHRIEQARVAAARFGTSVPIDEYFPQVVDHFDATNVGSWSQRFWRNASLWAGASSGAPVFIYLEGEGAGSPYSVLSGQHMELAAAHGALVVSLEHRFYGASLPSGNLTLAALRTLTSEQALGDLSLFISRFLVPTYGLDLAVNRIVTFGGSYPGALSAWARLRLPHQVAFAFSTSSPVEASFDFTAYCDVVSASLQNAAVGGSPLCRAKVASAFAAIDAALRGPAAGAATMAARVHSCAPPTSLDDTKLLASNLAGAIMGIVQYNEEASWASIATLCAGMTAPGADPVDAFAAALLPTLGGAPCMANDYRAFVAGVVGNTTADPRAQGVGIRAWTFQTCVQFSYFQTCEAGTQCPFSALMDLASQVKLCQDAFAPFMDAAFIAARVNFTNSALGGFAISGPPSETSNILFTNGGVDPWHSLSLSPDTIVGNANTALLIPTGAHCRNMRASSPDDPADVVAAREAAAAILAAFLAQPPASAATVL